MRTAGVLLMVLAAVGFLAGLSVGTQDRSGWCATSPDWRQIVGGLVCWGSVLLLGAFLCLRGRRSPLVPEGLAQAPVFRPPPATILAAMSF